MEKEEQEQRWKELLLSLRKVQSELPFVSDERLRKGSELDTVIRQMSKLVKVVHDSLDELKGQIEDLREQVGELSK